MRRKPYFNLWLFLFLLHSFPGAISVHATITVLNDWHLGENDSGAIPGARPTTAVDSVGGHNLTFGGGGTLYTSDTAYSAYKNVASMLSVCLTNSGFASNTIVSTVTDDFGLEAWVKPDEVINGQIIAYNGSTSASGWGILVSGSTYSAIYGGKVIFGTDTAVAGAWTHLALVKNNGTATLYVNGIASGTSTVTPVTPAGNFAVGTAPQSPTSQFFTGLIDEVRVFTFAANSFGTNDLLLNQHPPFTVSSTQLIEGPAAGTDFVRLASSSSAAWSASANTTWLHLLANSGVGSTNYLVGFTIDADTNSTRTGTLTIAGLTVSITQAGSNYVAAGVTTLVSLGKGNSPGGVAVDRAGNVFFSEIFGGIVAEWNPVSQTVTATNITGVLEPYAVAVDGPGNVYVGDRSQLDIVEWNSVTGAATNLVTGLEYAYGIAVDSVGDVYLADPDDNVVLEWNVFTGVASNVVSPSVLDQPYGVAVDSAGDVFIADSGTDSVKEWSAATQTEGYLVTGLPFPLNIAADNAGNVYIVNEGGNQLQQWNLLKKELVTLNYPKEFGLPIGAAVDGAGNVFLADYGINEAIEELPRAYVVPLSKFESGLAGTDSLPPVVPAADYLPGVVSDQPWLTITGIANGVVSYAFTVNASTTNRTANISLLGLQIPVTQPALFSLGASNFVEGPAGGVDSVLLAAVTPIVAWKISANASWLHLASAIGFGSTNVYFTFDANPGPTRTGTLTIAGETVTVTQASSTCVAAGMLTLVSSGITYPQGVAVDGAGNVYIADTSDNALKEWTAAGQTLTSLVSSGIQGPGAMALDAADNVYFLESSHNYVAEWNATSLAVNNLVTSGLDLPEGLAVDVSSNVYIADYYGNVIQEWHAASRTMAPLISTGLDGPFGVAVDILTNVYITDNGDSALKEWNPITHNVTTLNTPGLSYPNGVAVDGGGNVYITETGSGSLKKWSPATQTTTTLSGGLNNPNGVAVDGVGNVYVADSNNSLIRELPRAFVDNTPQVENGLAGSGSLPQVVSATADLTSIFNPVSDQSWLTVNGSGNNVVNYSFTANTGLTNRVAHIYVLGVSVTVTQTVIGTPPVLKGITFLSNGSLQFNFTNNPNATFSVLASSDLTLPLASWSVVGAATNVGGNTFQFSVPATTGNPQMFYRVSSP